MSDSEQPLTTCPEGWSADLLYRFPLSPWFEEAYGQDCYFSHLGYSVYAGTIIAISIPCLLLHFVTASSIRIKFLLVCNGIQVLNLLSVNIGLIIGWTKPKYFHFYFIFATLLVLALGGSVLLHGKMYIVKTIARTELTGKATVTSLMGGSKAMIIVGFLVLLGLVATVVGTCGISASVHLNNMKHAVAFYRVLCIGFCSLVLVIIYAAVRVYTRFIHLIENTIPKADGSSSASGEEESIRSQRVQEMKDVASRFRLARAMIIQVGVGGSLLWCVQATVLPTFWFIIQTQFFLIVVSGYIQWFTMTPMKQRQRIFGMTTTTQSNHSDKDPSMKQSKVDSKGQLSSSANGMAVQIVVSTGA